MTYFLSNKIKSRFHHRFYANAVCFSKSGSYMHHINSTVCSWTSVTTKLPSGHQKLIYLSVYEGICFNTSYSLQIDQLLKEKGRKQEINNSGKCHHIEAGEAGKMSINSIPYKSDLSSLSSSLQVLNSNCNNISIKLQSLPREMLWIHVFSWEQF